MQHILYILDYYLPHKWGLETVFEQIINRSLQQGYQVTILTSHYDPSLPKEEKIWNLRLIRTGKGRKSFMLSWFFKGRSFLRKHQDISFIHTSTYGGAIPASLLGLFFGKKVLLTVHEVFGKLRWEYKSFFSAMLHRIFEWIIFQLPFAHYHCVSIYTLNSLRILYGTPDQKLTYIPNGVDYQFWDRSQVTLPDQQKLSKKLNLFSWWKLLYFGHTGISKGIDTLVNALPTLLQEHQDIQIIFNFIHAQRDSYIKEKILKIQQGLAPHEQQKILLINGLEKKDLRTLVASVDAVVAPSLSEGFWSVHTETIALGTPLITTAVASLPEVVSGKVLLIPPASVQELTHAVARAKKGDWDILDKKVFSWDKSYEKLLKLYALREK